MGSENGVRLRYFLILLLRPSTRFFSNPMSFPLNPSSSLRDEERVRIYLRRKHRQARKGYRSVKSLYGDLGLYKIPTTAPWTRTAKAARLHQRPYLLLRAISIRGTIR